jgi:6,7-dimethyl-8-ribityllumazine synthase
LTVENEDQAIVRADPKQKDKGGEAAQAAMALLKLQGRFGG